MSRTFALLLGAAMMVVALDLVETQLAVSDHGGTVLAHDRSGLYVVGVAAASALWAGALTLTRSGPIMFTGGLVLGGAAGNLASIALWPSVPGVPDPIVAGGVAFNVADVAVMAGFTLLIPATLVFAVRNRARLFEPVIDGTPVRATG